MRYIDFVSDIDKISELEMLLEREQKCLQENINIFLKSKLPEGKNIIAFNNPFIIMNYEELIKDYRAIFLLLNDNKFYIRFQKPTGGIYDTLFSNINNEDTLRILKIIYDEKYKIL
jgi:hypothetical protein